MNPMKKSSVTWICFNVKLPERKGGFLVSFTRKERGYDVKVWQLGKQHGYTGQYWYNSMMTPGPEDAKKYATLFIKVLTKKS